MIINHYFDKKTGKLTRFVYLKRNNRLIEYTYEMCSDDSIWTIILSIYSKKEQILKYDMKGKRITTIKKKIYRCYHKEFEYYE